MTETSWNSAGLGVVVDPDSGHDHLEGRLSIPYWTRAGVWAIKARCMGEHDCKDHGHAKYLNVQGADLPLYSVDSFFVASGVILVTEGELDALAAQAATGLPAVAYPGTSGWKPYMSRCFSGFERVVVVADGDEPGRAAAKGVCKEIARFADTAVVVSMPDHEDSSSFIQAHGPDAYRQTLGV
jgi:DNA primase